jgi:PAS domain S-box-containing protein
MCPLSATPVTILITEHSDASVLPFLAAPGKMAAAMRAYSWEDTPLGPPAQWDPALKTLTSLMLASHQPMFIAWGPNRIWLYNDAFIPILGDKHPQALGRAALDEVWREARDVLEPLFDRVFAGQPVHMADFELSLDRHGKMEEAHFAFSYTPACNEHGAVVGLFGACIETTDQVLAIRQRVAAQERQRRLFEQAPGFIIIMRGADHVVEFVNDAHRLAFNSESWVGKPIREAFPSIEGQGFFERLDNVYRTGEPYQAQGAEVRFGRSIDEPKQTRFLTFVYAALHGDEGETTGIFCEGFDVTQAHRAQSRSLALAKLGQLIRDIDNPDDLAFAVAELLGRELNVSRAGYGTINTATETISIERDWNAPGIKSLAGVLHFRDYGSYIEDLKRGETVICHDAETDPRTAQRASALRAISAQSFVNMPVTEGGGFVALLYLNQATARYWPEEEITFIREVAHRTRTAVARRHAEAALRENERRLQFLDALGKETAKSNDANTTLAATTRMLGEYLKVAVCAYADMDGDEDGFTIRGNWSAPGSAGILGHYSLAEFGRLAVENLSAGRPLVLNDIASQLPAHEAATFLDIGLAATVCIPLVIGGKLTALMAIHDRVPRVWARNEIATLTEVTERSWAHIERVRLVEELRASEARYRGAVITGRIAAWETDLAAGTRIWTDEGMDLFGLDLPNRRGQVGGDNDEFWRSLHPDDRHLMAEFHRTADTDDSFPVEYRIVRPDGTVHWVSGRGRVVARGPDGKALRLANIVMDITDRKKAEEHVQLLMREISHRSKNLLAVVQSIAGQTARSVDTLESFEERFGERLRGLAASHDLMVEANWRGAALADLARQQLTPFADAGGPRLALDGPPAMLTIEATQALGLALHELATNAMKYGAWSAPQGKVTLLWTIEPEGDLRLSWIERGGPVVTAPARKGFGHVVIESMIGQSLDGHVAMDFDPRGLTWTLSIPPKNRVGS